MSFDAWGVPVLTAFLAAGGVKFIYDIWREYKHKRDRRPTEAMLSQQSIDANILTVARARDELEADNQALRGQLAEERIQHQRERENWHHERNEWAAEKARWALERQAYQEEIERLLARVREERAAAAQRYDALLAEITMLKTRHAHDGDH